MPVGTLPEKAKEIYESVYRDTLEDLKTKMGDDAAKAKASKIAWGAVKNAGYRKDESTGRWTKMTEPVMSVVFMGEDSVSSDGAWVEVACTGDVVDMHGHRVSITEPDLDRWVEAFETNSRGQELPITYDHPKVGGMAAGWFSGLKKGTPRSIMGKTRTPLLLRPRWTPKGKQSIENGDYRYFSVEILPDNTLRGGSLVNYPAIKGLNPLDQPIQAALGEYFCLQEFAMAEDEKKETPQEPGVKKCPECGAPIPEGAKTCPACGAKLEQEPKKEERMVEENREGVVSLQEFTKMRTQLSDLVEKVTSLTEANTRLSAEKGTAESAVTKLQETLASQETRIGELIQVNDMLRLHDKVVDFMSLADVDPPRQIAPAYEEGIINLLLFAETTDQEAEILDLLRALATGEAVVELGERGNGEIPAPRRGPSADNSEMHQKVLKLRESHPELSYRDALIQAYEEVRNG